jgi:hypothetical protein
VVIGLGGGFAVGRAVRSPPPAEDAVEPVVVPRTKPMATGLAAKLAEEEKEAARRAAEKPVAPPSADPARAVVAAASPTQAANPTRAATPTPTPAPTAVPKPVAKAKAHIRSTPDGAQVSRATDGEPLGTTPFDLELPESDKPIGLLFWKQGFAAHEEKIVPRGEMNLNVTLTSQTKEAAPRPIQRPRKAGGSKKPISNSTTIDPFN